MIIACMHPIARESLSFCHRDYITHLHVAVSKRHLCDGVKSVHINAYIPRSRTSSVHTRLRLVRFHDSLIFHDRTHIPVSFPWTKHPKGDVRHEDVLCDRTGC
jgi:hypothetical protein